MLKRLAPLALAVLVACLLGHHTLFTPGFDAIQGDEGDSRLVMAMLEHVGLFVARNPLHADFFSLPYFFPVEGTVAYSDTMASLWLPYGVIRLVGLDPFDAFQGWLLAMTTLNAIAAYLFLRRVIVSQPWASALGAVLFAAGGSRFCQINHPQLLPQFYPLLACVCFAKCLSTSSRGRGAGWLALAGFLLAAQFWGGFYAAWFFCFFLLLALGWSVALTQTRLKVVGLVRQHWPGLIAGAVSFSVVVGPLAREYLVAAREVGARAYVDGTFPELMSWFNVGEANWLWGFTNQWSVFQRLPIEPEQRLGLGLLTPVLVVAALWRHRRVPVIRLIAIVALSSMVLSTLYRGGHSPWYFVFNLIPEANAIRGISRIGLWLLLPASVGLAKWLETEKRWAWLLAVACLAEQRIDMWFFSKAHSRAEIAKVVERVRDAPHGCQVFFYAPEGSADPAYEAHLDAMFATFELELPTINGYSGNVPPGWSFSEFTDAATDDAKLTAWLSRNHMLDLDNLCIFH